MDVGASRQPSSPLVVEAEEDIQEGVIEPEILVTISLRLPQADRQALGVHLQDVMKEAVIAGGDSVHISLQPYTPEDEEDEAG